MSEEDRAQKEIEFSYIMLHIHKNNNVDQPQEDIEESKFKARIISIDIVISETLKMMRLVKQSEALLSLMQKFVLFKGNNYSR